MKRNERRKGFTLVELIIVLVILAILAALLVPALTGYLDRAKSQAAIAQCRSCAVAAQSILSEKYRNHDAPTLSVAEDGDEILALAEIEGTGEERFPLEFEVDLGRLMHLYYYSGSYYVTYCRDVDECADHAEVYTASTTAPAGSEAYSLKKTLAGLFESIRDGLALNELNQLNSSYKNAANSASQKFWASLTPSLQSYLGSKVWQGYGLKSSDAFSPPAGTSVTANRNLFTVTQANESTLNSSGTTLVYVYCVDDDGTLWRQQISASYAKDDQTKTGGAIRLGRINTGSMAADAWEQVS